MGPNYGALHPMKPLSCLLGCPARLWCGHNPDTAATVCPAVGWGTRALGPLCGLSGDLHPTLNNRVESQAGAGPGVVCRESAPCEQMKAGRGLAGGQRAGSPDLRRRLGRWHGSVGLFGGRLQLRVEGYLLLWEPSGWDSVTV